MKLPSRLVSALSVLALLSAGGVPYAYGVDHAPRQPASGHVVDPVVDSGLRPASVSQLVVKYRSSAPRVTHRLPTVRAASGVSLTPGSRVTDRISTVRLSRPVALATARSLSAEVAADPRVEYAEPDLWLTTADVPSPTPDATPASATAPNDPLLSSQWALASDFGIGAHGAWAKSRGSDVVVAVVDSGITDHPDLVGQTVAGYDMIADTSVSNDGDGRDADPSDPGDWDNSFPSSWHGTHVTGTIAASADNAVGVAGVAPLAKVQMLRALGVGGGGYMSDVVASIYWASGNAVVGVPANPTPAKVINLSLGGPAPLGCPSSMQSAINAAVAKGVAVVVAAGNATDDAGAFSPANCAHVITVAATGPAGYIAPYSNFGPHIDVASPGGDANYTDGEILSTLNDGTTSPGSPTYGSSQGTSMAAPHVSGAVALMTALAPGLTPAQIEARLKASARVLPNCTVSSCGSGLVDATAALPTSPGAPTRLTAVRGDRRAVFSWRAPSSSGGATITGYRVTASPGGRVCTTTGALRCPITGLTNGVSYTATATASNQVGVGPPSARSAAVVPSTTPGRPRSLHAAYPRAGRTILSWLAPASNGGSAVTHYAFRISTTAGTTWRRWIKSSARTTVTLTGLVKGRTYSIQVRAANINGPGPAAKATVRPTR